MKNIFEFRFYDGMTLFASIFACSLERAKEKYNEAGFHNYQYNRVVLKEVLTKKTK